MAHEFPWDTLKAETMRSVAKDLGLSINACRKRDEMVTFFKQVMADGYPALEAARSGEMRTTSLRRPSRRSTDSPSGPSRFRRKSTTDIPETPQTRKRAADAAPPSASTRAKRVRTLTKRAEESASQQRKPKPSRTAGSPRKNKPSSTPATSAPASPAKKPSSAKFAGVQVPKRVVVVSKDKQAAKEQAGKDGEAENGEASGQNPSTLHADVELPQGMVGDVINSIRETSKNGGQVPLAEDTTITFRFGDHVDDSEEETSNHNSNKENEAADDPDADGDADPAVAAN